MKRFLMAVLLLGIGLPALAQKPVISMLDLGGAGDAADADVVAVTDSLAAALDKAGAFDVIGPERRDQLLLRRGFWIDGAKGLTERLTVAGRCLDAGRMIGGQIEHGAAGFGLSLQLVDVASGAVLVQFRQERLADPGAVADALTDAVRQFLGAPQPVDSLKNKAPRGSYKIDSRPAGARISIDGLAKGVSPLRADSLLAGPHQVFLDLDKFRRTYYVIHVRKNGLDSVTVKLEPKKAGEPDRPVLGAIQAPQPDPARLNSSGDGPKKSYFAPTNGSQRPVPGSRSPEGKPPRDEPDSIPGKNAYVALDKNPEPLKTPQPAYPDGAKKAGINGKVFVQMLVDTDGRVARADIAKSSGNASLDDAAIETARQWLFTPAIAPGGKPVRVWVMQAFTFGKK